MDFSSIRETRGFDIQTRDVRNPPEALRGPLKCDMGRSPFTTKSVPEIPVGMLMEHMFSGRLLESSRE